MTNHGKSSSFTIGQIYRFIKQLLPSSSVRRLILNYDLHKRDYAPRFQASLALRTWISGILNHSVQHFYCGMFNTGSPPQVEGSFVLTQCEMGLLM